MKLSLTDLMKFEESANIQLPILGFVSFWQKSSLQLPSLDEKNVNESNVDLKKLASKR
jgi:hypothetical protein